MDDNGNTRLQKMKSWFEDHPIFSVLMFLGTGMAGISTLVTSGVVILGTLGILNINGRQTPRSQSVEAPRPEIVALPSAGPSAAPHLIAEESQTPPVRAEMVRSTEVAHPEESARPAEKIRPVETPLPTNAVVTASTPEPEVRRAAAVVHSPTPAPVKLQRFFPAASPQPAAVTSVESTPVSAEPAASVAPVATPEKDELVPVRRAERASSETAQE